MGQNHYFRGLDLSRVLLRLIDAALIFMVGYIVDQFRAGELLDRGNYQFFLVILAILTFNIFSAFSIYEPQRGESISKELRNVTIAWTTVVICISALTFITKTGFVYSRLWAGWTFVFTYFAMITCRILLHIIIRYRRSLGYNQKNIVILGAGKLGKKACDSLIRRPWVGLKCIAFFDDDISLHRLRHKGVEVIGSTSSAAGFIENQRVSATHPVDQVWISLPLSAAQKIESLQTQLLDTATKVYLVPDIYGFNLASYKVGEVAGLPIMKMSDTPLSGLSALLKRIEDLVLSFILLLSTAPIFLIIALLIKLETPGPVFFKQHRYGQDGREILVWKFRSMSVTEDGASIKQAQRNDERITKTGSWLRRLSLDELPQLVNVFLGTMSLVGPRPHAVAHNEYYRTKVSGYMTRHQIKPGITGLAQVNGFRGETPKIEDMEERVRYDLEYIRNWTVFMDFKILFLTIPTLFNNQDTY